MSPTQSAKQLSTRSSLAFCAAIGALFLGSAASAYAQTAQNTTTSFEYDLRDNLTKSTAPLKRVTDQEYDLLNRMTLQKQPLPNTVGVRPEIVFGYDMRGQLTSVKDPRNLTTTYTIDGLGNQTAIVSPDTAGTLDTHDEAGNIKTSTDAKNQTTRYDYDVLNRTTLITYADTSFVRYTYDEGQYGLGRLTGISDVNGSITYRYDAYGHVLSETRIIAGITFITGYAYDSIGRLEVITYPSGRSVTYTRDAQGHISDIKTSKGGRELRLVADVKYQPFGGVLSFKFGNGQPYSRSYDLDGRTTSYTLNEVQQTIAYDDASRITGIAAPQATAATAATFGYDGLDRVTSMQGPAEVSYDYDAVGNRTSLLIAGVPKTSYAYGPTSNRLAGITGGQASTIVTDANGSIEAKGVQQFAYDARGRMVSATVADGEVQYRVNALGQRVQKITPTKTTTYHYDAAGKLIAETSGTTLIEYVFLNDMPVAVLK